MKFGKQCYTKTTLAGTIVHYNAAGNWHRINGPAIIYTDGEQRWFINSKAHREDGPAHTWTNGNKRWYLDNREYSEEDFNTEMQKRLSQ